MASKAEKLFASKAPWIMELLRRDFALDLNSAAAILGNLGHECGGFALMQEQKPTVKGSKGGYGWAQWTGPRRRAFEAYCERNDLNPAEDRANYGWLFVELSTSEKQAIAAVKKPGSLTDKVKAFEMGFERAGVKHYPSRNTWAARALDAYWAAGSITLPAWALPAKKPPSDSGEPQTGTQPNVVTVDGPKQDETTVVVVQTPDNPPVTNPVPKGKTGIMAIGALILGLVGYAFNYFFGG